MSFVQVVSRFAAPVKFNVSVAVLEAAAVFINYIHFGNIEAYFMGNGTRFFYKLMLLFNSKIHKYVGEFS